MKRVIIICEGPSERAYLQQLNQFLREMGIDLVIIPEVANGGNYPHVLRVYNKMIKCNRKADVHVWIDFDLYKRNDKYCWAAYTQRSDDIPTFAFSIQNFEDFLAMHFPPKKRDHWIDTMRVYNHWRRPLHAKVYAPLFRKQLNRYEKGSLRSGFVSATSLSYLKQMVDERHEVLFPDELSLGENFAVRLIQLLRDSECFDDD